MSSIPNIETNPTTIELLFKATNINFFLHLVCFICYVELILNFLHFKPLLTITLQDLLELKIGQLFIVIIGYFSIMSLIFKIAYIFIVLFLNSSFFKKIFPNIFSSWKPDKGYVLHTDILAYCYDSKDYEPLRMLEVHRKSCQDNYKLISDLAYLYFAAVCFSLINYIVLPASLFSIGFKYIDNYISTFVAQVIFIFFLLPLYLIKLDVEYSKESENYLLHMPIYNKITESYNKNLTPNK